MEPFSARFRRVIDHLHAARVQHAVVTNSSSAEWFLNPDMPHPGASLDAYLMLDRADFPRAKAALLTAGMIHRADDGIELFFHHPGDPIESAVRIAYPGKQVELRADAFRKQIFDAEFLEYLRKRETSVVTVTAREELDRLITNHIAPGLRTLGFRKHGRTFSKRRGTLLQLIYFHGSWCSDRHTLGFQIAINLWSDRIATLNPFKEMYPGPPYSLPKSGIPAAHKCHWTAPADLLFPKFAAIPFECNADSDNAVMAATIRDVIFNHAVPYLDPIESEAALLKHIQRTKNENLRLPPLYVAALHRIVSPLITYDAFINSLKPLTSHDKQLDRKWTSAAKRMRKARI